MFKKLQNLVNPPASNVLHLLNAQEIATDVETIHKAMKGLGTDENAVISVIGARSPAQMNQVSQSYKAAYGRDLYDGISDLTKPCITKHLETSQNSVLISASHWKYSMPSVFMPPSRA